MAVLTVLFLLGENTVLPFEIGCLFRKCSGDLSIVIQVRCEERMAACAELGFVDMRAKHRRVVDDIFHHAGQYILVRSINGARVVDDVAAGIALVQAQIFGLDLMANCATHTITAKRVVESLLKPVIRDIVVFGLRACHRCVASDTLVFDY